MVNKASTVIISLIHWTESKGNSIKSITNWIQSHSICLICGIALRTTGPPANNSLHSQINSFLHQFIKFVNWLKEMICFVHCAEGLWRPAIAPRPFIPLNFFADAAGEINFIHSIHSISFFPSAKQIQFHSQTNQLRWKKRTLFSFFCLKGRKVCWAIGFTNWRKQLCLPQAVFPSFQFN